MKLEIREQTFSGLNNLRDLWLFNDDNKIMVIRSFQYVIEKPEPEPAGNPNVFNRRKFKKKKAKEQVSTMYLTDIKIEGYHADLKFVGTYTEEFCENLIESYNKQYAGINLIDFRKRWTDILEQKNAFVEYETKMEAKAKKSKEESEKK
jgi:hypothetical protein